MNVPSIIESICRLPDEFHTGKKSIARIIVESGIENNLSVLTAQNIEPYISEHPELVVQWLDWSADKRVSSGWYFTIRRGKYVVGYFPKGEVMTFDERELACAKFISREVRSYINHLHSKVP